MERSILACGSPASLPVIFKDAVKMPATRTLDACAPADQLSYKQSPGATNSLKHGAIP